MKNTQWILIFGFALLASCASKEKLVGTSAAPAAQGVVKADKADGGNTDLKVKVEHLAPAERVREGAKDYVVWIQPDGASMLQNVGVLNVDKDLDGKYQTTIPYQKFRVVVTPEPAGNVLQPSGPIVFDQHISR